MLGCNISLGAIGQGAQGTTSQTLNAANTWLAFSFVWPFASDTLSAVRLYFSATAGTPPSITCDLVSDSSGFPASGAATESKSATAVNGGFVDFTGFTTSLTQGTRYWLRTKNADGSPATNTATLRWVTASVDFAMSSSATAGAVNWSVAKTTTGDGGWSANSMPANMRLKSGGGLYFGAPAFNSAAGTTKIFGTNEEGVKFTMPSGPTCNVKGAGTSFAAKTGSPPDGVVFKIYTGASSTPTLQGTSFVVPNSIAIVAAANVIAAQFASAIAIAPGTVVRVTLRQASGGGDASNYFVNRWTSWDSDANSLPLAPLGGFVRTSTTDGINFTDSNTEFVPIGLLLDSDGPFTVPASGGVTKHAGFGGGLVA